MKTFLLSISLLLTSVCAVFSQTATIQGNVQTNAAGDQSGIEVAIVGSTLDGMTIVNIDEVVYTDAEGDFEFTYTLYANPLYPAFSSNPYADIIVNITFHKDGFDDKEVLNVTANSTLVTMENTMLFPTGVVLYKPQIAMVRYDTLGQYPNVVWERAEGENIKTYIVYKLVSGTWQEVGQVPFDAHGVFEDADNVGSQQCEYQLQVIFEDDSKSDYSASMQSPKIEVSVENGVPRIQWASLNEISRIDPLLVRKVILYRSTSPTGDFEPVDELVITNLTQQELISKLTMLDQSIPAEGTYYYRIGHEYYNWIDPRNQSLKIESGPFILAMSNISEAQNAETAVSKVAAETPVTISVQGKIVQIQASSKTAYTIVATNGDVVAKGMVKGSKVIRLSPGIYGVRAGAISQAIIVQ